MLCHILSPCFFHDSKSHSVSFFALMWPEVERCSTSKCVGPFIIPPCKYLHKETSRLVLAKKESPFPGTLSCAEPYTAMSRVRQRSRANQAVGGEARREGWKSVEWKGWPVQAGRWKPEERGQMNRRVRWFKKGWGRLQSGRLRATALTHRADVRHHQGESNTL